MVRKGRHFDPQEAPIANEHDTSWWGGGRTANPKPDAVTARARAVDPETSHHAAAKVERRGTAQLHRDRIVASLEANGPQNGRELGESTGLGQHAVMKRMKELVNRELVVHAEIERDGQAVWRAGSCT